MKKIIFACLATLVVLAISCKSGGDGDPKAVLSSFFEALAKNDMAKARTLSTAESKSLLDMMEMAMKTDAKETQKFNPAGMQFGEPKIDGDKATVPVKEMTSGETMNYTLKKESGDWKVAFDKNSLMTMGMEKMKQEGMQDSVGNVLEELKNIDTDSLKASMNEGMKILDSVKREQQKP